MTDLASYIRGASPDFPKPGIVFLATSPAAGVMPEMRFERRRRRSGRPGGPAAPRHRARRRAAGFIPAPRLRSASAWASRSRASRASCRGRPSRAEALRAGVTGERASLRAATTMRSARGCVLARRPAFATGGHRPRHLRSRRGRRRNRRRLRVPDRAGLPGRLRATRAVPGRDALHQPRIQEADPSPDDRARLGGRFLRRAGGNVELPRRKALLTGGLEACDGPARARARGAPPSETSPERLTRRDLRRCGATAQGSSRRSCWWSVR